MSVRVRVIIPMPGPGVEEELREFDARLAEVERRARIEQLVQAILAAPDDAWIGRVGFDPRPRVLMPHVPGDWSVDVMGAAYRDARVRDRCADVKARLAAKR